MNNAEKFGISSDFPLLGALLNNGALVALIVAWMLTPGMIYVIAFLLEKRLAPIWRYNFLTFMPGDFFLGGIFALSVKLGSTMPEVQDRWYQRGWYNLACAGLGVVVFVIGRYILDRKDYGSLQLRSPSKRYHDFALYLGYGALLFRVGLPALFYGDIQSARIGMVALICCFVFMLVYDAIQTGRYRSMMYRRAHPVRGYCPFWWSKPFENDNSK